MASVLGVLGCACPEPAGGELPWWGGCWQSQQGSAVLFATVIFLASVSAGWSATLAVRAIWVMLVFSFVFLAGAKAFVCDQCGAQFSKEDALETHRQTHTGMLTFLFFCLTPSPNKQCRRKQCACCLPPRAVRLSWSPFPGPVTSPPGSSYVWGRNWSRVPPPCPWESSKARARQCSLLDLPLTCPFLSIPCRMTSAKHLLSVSKLTALTADSKYKTKLHEKSFFSWIQWQRREQAEVDPLHLVLSYSVPK